MKVIDLAGSALNLSGCARITWACDRCGEKGVGVVENGASGHLNLRGLCGCGILPSIVVAFTDGSAKKIEGTRWEGPRGLDPWEGR